LVPRDHFTKRGNNLGLWVTSQRYKYKLGKLSSKKQKALEKIPNWVWDALEAAWQGGFKHLLAYIKRTGKTVLPAKYVTEDGYKLESWVVRQRIEYRRGTLTANRQKALEKVPGWTWDPNEAVWQEGITHLRDYVEARGNTLVPATYKTENGFRLGQWVRVRRKTYHDGKLSIERQKALEQIPGWRWDHSEVLWQEGFKRLSDYAEREHHTKVPRRYVTEDGYSLGYWVGTQRSAYRQRRLSAKRKNALEQLPGWTWNPRKTIAKTGG